MVLWYYYTNYTTTLHTMTDKVQTKVYLPEELKDLVDADSRSNSEAVEAALWREYGGEKKTAIDRQVEQQQQKVSIVRNQRNEFDRELEEEKQKLRALEAKQERFQDAKQRAGEAVEEFVEWMAGSGEYVFADHKDVTELANKHFDGDREKTIQRLVDAAEEEGYDFDDRRFGL